MPQFFVRQPNGLLARFSTIVDSFCEVDLSRADALDWCRQKGLTEAEAEEKVSRAERDEPTWPGERRCCDQPGLHRWHNALVTILHVHGTAGLAEFLAECPETYAETA